MPSARQINWAKFRISALSIVAAAIVSTLFYLLTGGTLLQEKATLYLSIPDATGVDKGTPVRVDGIGVGKVSSVALTKSRDPNHVIRIAMKVERDHLPEIPADSTAQISSDTMIGDKFVDIDSGTSPNPIRPNAEVTYKETGLLSKRIDMAQFEDALRTMDATLTDIEQGRSRVGQFVVGEKMYQDMTRQVGDLQRGIRAARNTTDKIGAVLYTDKLYRQISEPLVELDRRLARLQSGQGAGRWLRDAAQYEQFRTSAADLRQSVANLSNGEFMASDRMYADWTRRLASLIQSVDEMNASPIFSSSASYDNLNGALREMQSGVREFRQNPKKYLRMKLF